MSNKHYVAGEKETCGVWRFAFNTDNGVLVEQCDSCGSYRKRDKGRVISNAENAFCSDETE